MRRSHLFRCQRVLLGFHEQLIHLTTYPCIGCRVKLLGIREFHRFPIRQLLGLGNPHAQNYGGHFLYALVLDAIFPDDFLQIHEVFRFELAIFLKPPHVVMHCRPDLDDFFIGQYTAEFLVHAQHLYPEQKCLRRTGELQQCDAAPRLLSRKTRPRFRIESNDFLTSQIRDSPVKFLTGFVNYGYLAAERRQLQLFYLLGRDTTLEHTHRMLSVSTISPSAGMFRNPNSPHGYT